MRYAIVNGERCEAQPNLSGLCPICGAKTVAKCGEVKIWHWAHSGKRMCDQWWENETEWHRSWKNHFPASWQEIIQQDTNGERHIADVKTAHGWVLEFQHSFLPPEERRARNTFYKKLAWVVDGTRRSRDKKQFYKSLNELNYDSLIPEIRQVSTSYECALIREWSGIEAPVFIDFGEEILWCLLPMGQTLHGAYVASFTRHMFIELHNMVEKDHSDFQDALNKIYILVNTLAEAAARSRSALIARMRIPNPRPFTFQRVLATPSRLRRRF